MTEFDESDFTRALFKAGGAGNGVVLRDRNNVSIYLVSDLPPIDVPNQIEGIAVQLPKYVDLRPFDAISAPAINSAIINHFDVAHESLPPPGTLVDLHELYLHGSSCDGGSSEALAHTKQLVQAMLPDFRVIADITSLPVAG